MDKHNAHVIQSVKNKINILRDAVSNRRIPVTCFNFEMDTIEIWYRMEHN